MNGWSFHNPVRVTFGTDALNQIGRIVAGRRYLLITHPDAVFEPLKQRIEALAGQPLATIDTIEPNPSLAMLARICERLTTLAERPEVLVALGGGSVIDTAKFLAAGHGAFEPVMTYLADGGQPAVPALPIIAVPTTSGTGSDVTCWATVWDPEKGRKLSLAREDLYPEASIVDPALVAKLPWGMTLASGLDALSHALESIWNINASPVTRGYAIAAARDVMAGLDRLDRDPGDLEARSLMALGALRAGLAFSNTKTALAHNISYPVTLRKGVPHGIACSFCLPEVMTAVIGIDEACDAALGEIFGTVADAPERLRAFLDRLGIAALPAAYGIGPTEWIEIVEDGFAGPRGRNFIGTRDRFPIPALPAAHRMQT